MKALMKTFGCILIFISALACLGAIGLYGLSSQLTAITQANGVSAQPSSEFGIALMLVGFVVVGMFLGGVALMRLPQDKESAKYPINTTSHTESATSSDNDNQSTKDTSMSDEELRDYFDRFETKDEDKPERNVVKDLFDDLTSAAFPPSRNERDDEED